MDEGKIKVIKIKNGYDEQGFVSDVTMSEVIMFYNSLSLNAYDFYKSKANNIQIDEVIIVRFIDYDSEVINNTEIQYDRLNVVDLSNNKKYKIVRSYHKMNSEFVELYLEDIMEAK